MCSCLPIDFVLEVSGDFLFFSNTIIAIAIVTHSRMFQWFGLNVADGTLSPGIAWERNTSDIIRCFNCNI